MSTQKGDSCQVYVLQPCYNTCCVVGGLTVLLGPANHSHTIDKVASAENNSQRLSSQHTHKHAHSDNWKDQEDMPAEPSSSESGGKATRCPPQVIETASSLSLKIQSPANNLGANDMRCHAEPYQLHSQLPAVATYLDLSDKIEWYRYKLL